jgi:starch synthase
MHVVFLSMEYPPLPSGGIGTSICNLARAIVAQGHRVTVLGFGKRAEFQDQGVDVRFIGETSIPKVGWLWDVRRAQRELNNLIRRDGADIVEAPDWSGVSAGLRPSCPILIRCHGTDTYFAHLLQEKVRPLVHRAEWLALKQADDIVAVTQFAADLTRRLFSLPQRIPVIHNGIDVAQFKPASPEEVEPDTILYFGALVRKKGVLDLCSIFSKVTDRYPRARLRIVGHDAKDRQSGAPSMWALCQELLSSRARERVEYLGPQPYDQVREHVRRAALCVFPSYAETFGLTWVEAMACAKAVIAYNIGTAPEIIEHNISGKLIPVGDTERFAQVVHELLTDWEECRRLGLAARRRVESLFASNLVARQSIERYQQVLKR